MLRICAVALVAAVATGAMGEDCLVTVREEVMHVREGRYIWFPHAEKGAAATYDGDGVVFSKKEGNGGIWVNYNRQTPGEPRLPGAKAFVVKLGADAPDGRVRMNLRREGAPKDEKALSYTAPWRRETRFDVGLPSTNHYYLATLTFDRGRTVTNFTVRLRGIDAITEEPVGRALRVDIHSSGNEFRAVRYALGETAYLTFRNPTSERRTWRGAFTATDYFGRTVEIPYDVTIDPGETVRRDLPRFPTKGIWRLSDTLRLAVLDVHEITPLQPENEFRLGVNYHATRYTEDDRAITMDAAVAIGVKLMRGNYNGSRLKDGSWDFARINKITDELLAHGIAIDAIMDWGREQGVAAARAFGNRIAWYEMGNERDMTDPKKCPYAGEVESFKAFSEGVKSVFPAAKVIYGGFSAESSFKHPAHLIRPGFQEDLMTECRDWYDAHAIHLHCPFKAYVDQLANFMSWRKQRGIADKPWYANETAVSTTRVGEDAAAAILWEKVLYAWSRGSVDYIWYNLRATGYDPSDSEQGYGLMTADYRPRATFAAFSALAKVFFRLVFDKVLHDGKDLQVMRWVGERNGKPCCVIAGWNFLAPDAGCRVWVKSDAVRAAQVDLMGNVSEVEVKNGFAVWTVGKLPSVLVLVGATAAEPDMRDLAAEAFKPKVIVPGDEDEKRPPDLLLSDYDQVYEIYEAKPEYCHRTWRWWGDLRAKVWFSRQGDEVKVHVLVEDDIHKPVPEEPLEGDACVLKIGNETVTLVADGDARDRWRRTHYWHVFKVPVGMKVPFNVRIYENDGEGPDGWMEYSPFDETPQVEIKGEGEETGK